MRVIEKLTDLEALGHAVVTSGTFDGVHLGHRKILRRLRKLAKQMEGESLVLTYWPHPRSVLGDGWGDLRLLSTFEEKVRLLSETGIDYLVKIPFTREFSEMSSEAFVNEIIVEQLGTKKLVIGYDHRFGRNREGGFDYLKANQHHFGFEIEEISREDIDEVGVSSTKIRKALSSGDAEQAAKFLGRPYQLTGIVTKGDQLGRTLGFPTANVYIPEAYKLIPADGVYVVQVTIDGELLTGMLNIGMRPTLDGTKRQIEVHIFNFDQDIYGTNIEVHLLARLRYEQKFDNMDALKQQLEVDKEAALSYLKTL
ncbi:MAG: bifunctional riboflavin kinase/FAD synthetase [Bacteroidota bacterium]